MGTSAESVRSLVSGGATSGVLATSFTFCFVIVTVLNEDTKQLMEATRQQKVMRTSKMVLVNAWTVII